MMISQRMIQPVISGQKRPELLVSQLELEPQITDIGITRFRLDSMALVRQVYFIGTESEAVLGFELNDITVRDIKKVVTETASTVTGFSLDSILVRSVDKYSSSSDSLVAGFSLDEVLLKDFGLKIQERRDSNVVTRFELNEITLTEE